jgi:CubicO group peptidase (beta-lactamase class C family)
MSLTKQRKALWFLLPLIFPPIFLSALVAGAEAPSLDFSAARQVLTEAIADRAFPGCAVAVGTSHETLWLEGLGRFDYENGPQVMPESLYDLASLTKAIGTTSVVIVLLRDGKLRLDDRLVSFLPEFTGGGREDVTVEHLLTHSSGLPAGRPLHEQATGYRQVIEHALTTRLEARPGETARYSDLGYILLGELVARVGKAPLAALERKLVFDPLGLEDTLRRPALAELPRIVPTERRRPVTRGGKRSPGKAGSEDELILVRGTVHDENADAGDGLTGHAGLFSTAKDLSVFAGELLRALKGESQLFPRQLALQFFRRRELVGGSSRALGWDTPSGVSSAGTLFSSKSFGHTGFTGTSMWMDPERDLFVVLLSNRVHPTRKNRKISKVRPRLADAVVRGLKKAK